MDMYIYGLAFRYMFRCIRKGDYEHASKLIDVIITSLNRSRKKTGLAFYEKECKRMWKYYEFIRKRYIEQLEAEIDEISKTRQMNKMS